MTRDEVCTAVVARVIEREGGIKDVGDGKGVTRFGQTPDWLQQFRLPPPENASQAAANYRAWLRMTRLEEVCDADDALADFVIDFAVHSGHVVAIRRMQRPLGGKPDGIVGPGTVALLKLCDRRQIAKRVLAEEISYQGELITENPQKYAEYAKGWARRNAKKLVEFL